MSDMGTDEALQHEVQAALKRQPELSVSEIGVAVQGGIVTLTGTVDQYGKKEAAEHAAAKVRGVKGIVEHIEVQRQDQMHPTDAEIAMAICDAYKWRWDIPGPQLRVRVEDGEVLLDGEVAWKYQKEAARSAAAQLIGVKSVHDRITVRPPDGHAVRVRDVQGILWRNPDIDDEDIHVEAMGGLVVLRGSVPTLAQKKEAGRMAWNAPGVTEVENLLVIQ